LSITATEPNVLQTEEAGFAVSCNTLCSELFLEVPSKKNYYSSSLLSTPLERVVEKERVKT
jgi:hypothetical protein